MPITYVGEDAWDNQSPDRQIKPIIKICAAYNDSTHKVDDPMTTKQREWLDQRSQELDQLIQRLQEETQRLRERNEDNQGRHS